VSYSKGEGLPGWAAGSGEVVVVADAIEDSRHVALPSWLDRECRACLCVPLRIQEEVIGVMAVRKREVYEFSQEQVMLLETVCKQVAIVIEKARMYGEKMRAEQLAAIGLSLSGLAHYIKNILFTSQVGEYMVDKGLNEWNDLDRVREGWKTLHQANQKIRKLVENMLNYTRRTKLELKPVNFNRLVHEIVDAVRDHALQKRIDVVTDLDPGVDSMKLEPDSIHDAVLNLVTNAMDAIPDGRGGRIEIHSQRLPGQHNLRVDVVDNGNGIPEEHRDKIFNLFFSTKGKRGTGIGLAATRKVVEDHGGTIECDSTVGTGSRFTIFLPIVDPDADSAP
jgi:signal transduction histidine kinase